MSAPVYTFVDHMEGRCSLAEIGQLHRPVPAPEPPAPPPEPLNEIPDMPDFAGMSDAEIAQASVRLLRQSTIEVFHKMGASTWLFDLAREDPKTFLRMLQRLLPQSIEATVTVAPFEVPKAIRDLSLDDLRAMRTKPGSIIDADFTECART